MALAQTGIESLNVADRLVDHTARMPEAVAIACPRGYDAAGKRQYDTVTFAELQRDVDRIARGLIELGATPGMRLAMLVRPGIEFVAIKFALLRAGVVSILVDPGMGRKHLIGCLADARPEGFIAIPSAHAVRTVLRHKFPDAGLNVTVGRRWFWGGETLDSLRSRGETSRATFPMMQPEDPTAIIFTSGSTGPPKGVLYRQITFDTQVSEIRDRYDIQPGEIDLACFPLFGLFNAALGVTTIFPEMDFSRPATVDPEKIIEAVNDWQVNKSFASPAVWDRVGTHCVQTGQQLPTLRRIHAAGAPVRADILRRMKGCIHPEGEIHTPYGATEALPVATISSSEILGETADRTDEGAGVCVGRCFDSIEWQVIRIDDAPIATIDDAEPLPSGEIGELIVRGPQVTPRYVTQIEWNARSKIADGETIWHRMGDVGYFDDDDRFWFCGRKAHRVETPAGPLYTIPCEAVFNRHAAVTRTALVGLGLRGDQRPVVVVELLPDHSATPNPVIAELQSLGKRYPHTRPIRDFLFHPSLPVDVRHNAKINREELAAWAATLDR